MGRLARQGEQKYFFSYFRKSGTLSVHKKQMTRRFELLFRNLNRRDSTLWSSLVSVEKAADEISSTGGPRRLSPITATVVLLIREFEAAWAAQKKRITVKVIRFLWSIGDSNS